MVVAFYFRLHLAYFPRPVVAIFARPEQYQFPTMQIGGYLLILILLQLILSVWEIRDLKKRSLTEQMRAME